MLSARAIPLAAALLGLPAARPAAARAGGPALPQDAVPTNLRSPTGRTVFLVLRPPPGQEEHLRARAADLARSASATLRLRPARGLLVAVLSHATAGLNVHRQGRELRVSTGPTGSLEEALAAGVRLRGDSPDPDLDQEILLRARAAMRDREEVRPALVALAQGAAARQLLLRYVAGDDVGAALWGRRDLPLLQAHPDAALLKEVALTAWEALTVPPPAWGPRLPAPDSGPPGAWAAALYAAADSGARARRALQEPPQTTPVPRDGAPQGEDKDEKR